MIDVLDVERYLSLNSAFCMLDWCIEKGYLSYSDYERWRYEKIPTLDNHWQHSEAELKSLFDNLKAVVARLSLVEERQFYYSWSMGAGVKLRVSLDNKRNHFLCLRWRRAQDIPQMDLFMDNSAAILENEFVGSLSNHQWGAAQTAYERLQSQHPNHTRLGQFQDLLNYADYIKNTPQISASDFDEERQGLEMEVVPMAHEILNERSRDYLSQAWQRLAKSAPETFSAIEGGEQSKTSLTRDDPRLKRHASYAFSKIGDWKNVISTIEGVKQWENVFGLVYLMATSFEKTFQHNFSQLQWARLFDLNAVEAEVLINVTGSGQLMNIWDDFCDAEVPWPREFFSGFIFLKNLKLAQLSLAEPLVRGETVVIRQACSCVLGSQDELEARKSIQAMGLPLLDMYLSVRQNEKKKSSFLS